MPAPGFIGKSRRNASEPLIKFPGDRAALLHKGVLVSHKVELVLIIRKRHTKC